MPRESVSIIAKPHLWMLWGGVFFTFGCMGPVLMMLGEQPTGWGFGLVALVVSGTISLLWCYAFVAERLWLLIPILPGQFFLPQYVFQAAAWAGVNEWGFELPGQRRLLILAIESVVSLVIGYVLNVRFARRMERASARWRAELDVARRIHESIVPSIALSLGEFDVFARSVPSSEMGGDLVDTVSHGDELVAILADVSGHGVGAGIVMGMVKSSARALLLAKPELSQLLTNLNVVLADLTKPEMFATMATVRVGVSGRFEYGLAGHLPILHVTPAGELREWPNGSLPLGVEPGERFETGRAELGRGDTLVLFTDGLMEVQNAEGRELGLAALREVVRANAGRPLGELADAIFNAARAHGTQLDDQSVLLIRRRG